MLCDIMFELFYFCFTNKFLIMTFFSLAIEIIYRISYGKLHFLPQERTNLPIDTTNTYASTI
jgi:hypothetical protein